MLDISIDSCFTEELEEYKTAAQDCSEYFMATAKVARKEMELREAYETLDKEQAKAQAGEGWQPQYEAFFDKFADGESGKITKAQFLKGLSCVTRHGEASAAGPFAAVAHPVVAAEGGENIESEN